jgi:porphobilinogen synthase
VSGEYAQIEIAARAGALDRERAIIESLTAIRRAGADIILSYYTPWILGHLAGKR